MPEYSYRAFSSSGIEHEGRISATSSEEAINILKSRDLKIRSLKEVAPPSFDNPLRGNPASSVPPPSSPPAAAPAQPTPPKPQQPPANSGRAPQASQAPQTPKQPLQRPSNPPLQSSPPQKPPSGPPTPSRPTQGPTSAARPRMPGPQPIDLSQAPADPPPGLQLSGPSFAQQPLANGPAPVINVPVTKVKPNILTAPGNDKERIFLFAQIAAALRAGINPATAFQDIAGRTPAKYRDSLLEMATMATEGMPASKVMERYPDLYPDHIPSTIRAGEIGGFEADAYDAVSQQAENAHKFRKWFWFVYALVINAAFGIPLALLIRSGLTETYKEVEKGNQYDMGAGIHAAGVAFGRLFVQQTLPLLVLFVGGSWFIYKFFLSRASVNLRHTLAYKWPVIGQRSRFEGLTTFSWVMGKLSQAGIPYGTAWEIAVGAVPNRRMRDELQRAVGVPTGTERVSDLFSRTTIFPPEYASVVATGEYSGNLPGSMEQLSRMSKTDFETQTNISRARTGCWGMLGCMVTSAIFVGIVLVAWYYELPKAILSGLE